MYIAGIVGFALMLVYDINSYTVNNRVLQGGFYAGCLLVVGATAAAVVKAVRAGAFSDAADVLLLSLSLISFALLIYCLFFALPFAQTYQTPQNGRRVYRCGAYALCRHPGVLCFWGVYLFLGWAALPDGRLMGMGLLFSLLNTAYAWFQDRITFPKTFCDYDEYRKTAPFLLPTVRSIVRAGQTWGALYGKEEQP